MLLHLPALSLGFYSNFILIARSAQQLKCSTFHPIPFVYNQEPFPVSGVKDRARAQGLWVERSPGLVLSSAAITSSFLWEQGCLPTDNLSTCSLHVFCHLDYLCYLLTHFPFIPGPSLPPLSVSPLSLEVPLSSLQGYLSPLQDMNTFSRFPCSSQGRIHALFTYVSFSNTLLPFLKLRLYKWVAPRDWWMFLHTSLYVTMD